MLLILFFLLYVKNFFFFDLYLIKSYHCDSVLYSDKCTTFIGNRRLRANGREGIGGGVVIASEAGVKSRSLVMRKFVRSMPEVISSFSQYTSRELWRARDAPTRARKIGIVLARRAIR